MSQVPRNILINTESEQKVSPGAAGERKEQDRTEETKSRHVRQQKMYKSREQIIALNEIEKRKHHQKGKTRHKTNA